MAASMNMKRMRGRNNRGGGGGGGPVRHQSGNVPMNRNHVFDSSGPDLRIRGTSQQLFEKYLQLGRDATSAGDRVMAESYFQYAEHYFRILNAMNQAAQQGQQGGQQNGQGGQGPNGHHSRRGEAMGEAMGESAGDGSEGSGSDDDGSDNGPGDQGGRGEPQVAEARPIAISAGAPEN